MVIGNGLLANAFSEYKESKNYLFFCSGVSNSLCKEQSEFDREINLLSENIAAHPEMTFVYFSTCSVYDPSMVNSLYVKHKLRIEEIIKASCQHFHIFRLSNVVGHTKNPVTILNFLYSAVKTGSKFNLWKKSKRNLIDVEDVVLIVKEIIGRKILNNATVNIANPHSYNVTEIVSQIEQYLGKKGDYDLVEQGGAYVIDIEPIQEIIKELGINFDDSYFQRLLVKYYPK